jgi:hypothetical protein
MDVMSKEQAILAEEAGAAAIMVLEKIPSLIRKEGGVARMVRPLCNPSRPAAFTLTNLVLSTSLTLFSPTHNSSRTSWRQSLSPSWPRSVWDTLQRLRSSKPSVWITSMVSV